jgi:hypothetical protein
VLFRSISYPYSSSVAGARTWNVWSETACNAARGSTRCGTILLGTRYLICWGHAILSVGDMLSYLLGTYYLICCGHAILSVGDMLSCLLGTCYLICWGHAILSVGDMLSYLFKPSPWVNKIVEIAHKASKLHFEFNRFFLLI